MCEIEIEQRNVGRQKVEHQKDSAESTIAEGMVQKVQ
jgi:hypothetical protein